MRGCSSEGWPLPFHFIFLTSCSLFKENTLFLLCARKMTGMRTRNEYIHLLRSQEAVLRQDYGIRSLRLFGSVAREQQTEQSDIDVYVEMDPKPFVRLHVKDYLERLLGCSVDVFRKHQHMNSFLLNQIDKEGIYVF